MPDNVRFINTCKCGKRYKSELALSLCVGRFHAPLQKIGTSSKQDDNTSVSISVSRNCKRCKDPMAITTGRNRYCETCKGIRRNEYNQAYLHRKKEKGPLANTNCIDCGKEILRKPRGRPKVYCIKCKMMRTREKATRYRALHPLQKT